MIKDIKKVIANLKKRQIKAVYVTNKKQALKKVLSMISKGKSVGLGGSQTLNQIGLIEALSKNKINIINKPVKNISREKVLEKRRKAVLADYFIMSTNALTKDGILINIDGYGNRLAAISFGAKNVIVIIGKNKIVKNLKEGIKKICPAMVIKNAQRLNWGTPCMRINKCSSDDCFPPYRMCNQTLIIEGSIFKDRIKLVIVDEELGY